MDTDGNIFAKTETKVEKRTADTQLGNCSCVQWQHVWWNNGLDNSTKVRLFTIEGDQGGSHEVKREQHSRTDSGSKGTY
ncbi:unnamed protein product [Acanthoscelides obtectus]|uniref:Uncharacterized protein n=1 Tax=Acanthoscelides obtectus TaxID=200917 RepID=A0A9P0MAF3_ACAOB|nr:unnamed protein product [Acanthoscelides obtectus]CAK1627202.1 hypothetical protein AOBTE_LOCUS4386 [Acanthoscelides obtectus]